MQANLKTVFRFVTTVLGGLVLLSVAGIHPTIAANAHTLPGMASGPVLVERSSQLERTDVQYRKIDNSISRVWVAFKDKGVADQQAYNRVAAAIALTKRSSERRAKVGKDQILFLDLPVMESYVQQVAATGATLRHRSRWLNAVSVDATADQLAAIRLLPSVANISSVAGFRGTRDQNEPQESGRAESPSLISSLSYGSSLAQLDQLKVPVAHGLGLTGHGVFLAFFDSGYRTSHEAFSNMISEGRLIAQYDFVFNDSVVNNQGNDDPTAWNHGTFTVSTATGEKSGTLYGPAYKASLVLCKTEDVRSETPVEEDNWEAALEFVDSIGVDVVSSSLGYLDWYTYPDFNGLTATTTLAANTAASLGIVVCNAMGNEGPGPGSLDAPADAFDILSCGSVTSLGGVSGFSSRGPTFDGRTKPEVCARGSSTFCASASGTSTYTSVSGTSLSTPLVAGVTCLLIEARPGFTPLQIRQALMESASNAATPDNNIGWGIVNIEKALDWGLDLTSNVSGGNAPLTVNFTATSPLSPTSYFWNFGDGNNSASANPSHVYASNGTYLVTCTITSPYGTLVDTVSPVITVIQNSVSIEQDSAYAGHLGSLTLNISTPVTLTSLNVPLVIEPGLHATLTAVSKTNATTLFDTVGFIAQHPATGQYVIRFKAKPGGFLPIGNYAIADVSYRIDSFDVGGLVSPVDASAVDGIQLSGIGPQGTSTPAVVVGSIGSRWIKRGNADNSPDLSVDIGDLTYLVDNLFISFPPLVTIQSGDCNVDLGVDIGDLTYMVDFLFLNGPAIPTP